MTKEILMLFALTSTLFPESMPPSALSSPFDIVLNRGPAGRFPSGGCMELAVRLDGEGLAHQVSIIRSSRYYPIDRAVLSRLKTYKFDVTGLPHGEVWRVFFNWSKDGRETRLSSTCAISG